jgi:hypothetical protein
MYEHDERQYVGENGREPPLDAARRPNAELEAADVDQHSLENTFVSAQMRPPHAPGVVERGEGAFDSLAALPHQAGPRPPRMRRRLRYTGAWADGCFDQRRRPRSGSASMAVVRPFNKPAATSL